MKRTLIILLTINCSLLSIHCAAQLSGQALIDSFQKELSGAKEDTNKVMLFRDIAYEQYRFNLLDTALENGRRQLSLANKLQWQSGVASANNILGMCHLAKNEKSNALACFGKALKMYEQQDKKERAANIAFNIGVVYWNANDNAQAIQYFFRALKISENTEMCDLSASCYTTIAAIYGSKKEYTTAAEYHRKALKIAETCDRVDKVQLAEIYSNIGICYHNKGDCDSSLIYNLNALALTKQLGLAVMAAGVNSNMSLNYTKLKDFPKAIDCGQRSLAISDSIHNKHEAASALYALGYSYVSFATDTTKNEGTLQLTMGGIATPGRQGAIRISLKYLTRALDSIRGTLHETGLEVKIYESLSIAYRLNGEWEKALLAHDRFVAIKDSIFTMETAQQLATQQMQYDFSKKEAATKALQEKKYLRQKNIRNSTLAGMAGLLIFSLVVIRQRNRVKMEKANVEVEKEKSDALLLNILPHEVAEELKTKGTTTAMHYDNVTVLFTDFVDFTQAADQMSPQSLIDELHACFTMFDEITSKYNIEKIKTIGDAYLAVCGLPSPNPSHAENTLRAALEINSFMSDRLAKMGSNRTFNIRIGIHSGSVAAGIVGVKKFAYDIWGDTVNIAARMEQNSEAGKINISESTYEMIKDKFLCEYRGKLEVKGKGAMKMYFIS
jgi:adenylate cyclase